jgi:hypothetical protein
MADDRLNRHDVPEGSRHLDFACAAPLHPGNARVRAIYLLTGTERMS